MLTNPRSDRVRSVHGLGRRPVRERTGRFLVEGPQGVREAVRYAADRVVDLYVTSTAAQRYALDIVQPATAAGLWVHEVSDEVLAAMSDADAPQGILAVVTQSQTTLEEVLAKAPRRLILLTHVRDPGNAGTVIRGADAAGFDAVLVSDSSVDVNSPKVIRSTAGSTFHLPVVTGLDIDATMAHLASYGIWTVAADGSGETLLADADLERPHCWVMGNEAWGLPEAVQAACDEVVRIPIYGKAESLNLAMAATLCVYASAGARLGRRST